MSDYVCQAQGQRNFSPNVLSVKKMSKGEKKPKESRQLIFHEQPSWITSESHAMAMGDGFPNKISTKSHYQIHNLNTKSWVIGGKAFNHAGPQFPFLQEQVHLASYTSFWLRNSVSNYEASTVKRFAFSLLFLFLPTPLSLLLTHTHTHMHTHICIHTHIHIYTGPILLSSSQFTTLLDKLKAVLTHIPHSASHSNLKDF